MFGSFQVSSEIPDGAFPASRLICLSDVLLVSPLRWTRTWLWTRLSSSVRFSWPLQHKDR